MIVIGGGVIGLAVADALSREQVRVAVLERGICGQESSWAGAGIVQSGSWHRQDALVEMQREAVRTYDAFADDLRDRTGINPEFARCGSLELLLQDQQYRMARSEIKAATAFGKAYGHPVCQLLSPEEALQREEAITTDLLGAKYCPVSGQVRNPRLVQALAEACRRGGVEIVEGCGVTKLLVRAGKVVGVETEAGRREAGHVVLAAGCWSSLLDDELAATMPVVPVRGQMALLKFDEPIFNHVIERGRTYLVPRRDGHVLIGATQEPSAGYDKSVTVDGIAGLLNFGRRLVPRLGEAELVRTWAGLRPGTPDGRPYLGAVPDMPGLLAATGHFRSGLTLAPVTGRVLADLIVRGRTALDISRCLPGREVENRLKVPAASGV